MSTYDNLMDLWAAGLSASEVGSRLGISRNAVIGTIRRARRRGDKRADRVPGAESVPPRGPSPLPAAEILALWQAGTSCRGVACQLGLSYNTVRELLLRTQGTSSHRTPRANPGVEIPKWVPARLHALYQEIGKADGEEEAASYARAILRAERENTL